MPYSLQTAIQASIAGQVLEMIYLQKIREDASAAYSCGAYGSASLADDGFHVVQMIGYCPMKPEKKDIALKIMTDEANNLTKACDAEKLNKIKTLMLKQIDDRAKTNNFWSDVIYRYDKMNVDTYTDYKKTVEAQTPATIMAFMKQFLSTGNKVSVIMLPDTAK